MRHTLSISLCIFNYLTRHARTLTTALTRPGLNDFVTQLALVLCYRGINKPHAEIYNNILPQRQVFGKLQLTKLKHTS